MESLPESLCLDSQAQEDFKQKIQAYKVNKPGSESQSGVVFVKHIPYGFYEPQMKKYFEQFGEVTRLRLSRSKKTGRSKGYAYIQFASEAVAKIVADSMKDYLMFRRRLMCQFIPSDKVHKDTFKGANRLFRKPKAHLLDIERQNRRLVTKEKLAKATQKLKTKSKKQMKKIKELGVEYSLP